MPGGNPLLWSFDELNNALAAKKSDRDFIKKMGQYLIYWMAYFSNRQVDLRSIDPDYFMEYLDQEYQKEPKKPGKQLTPDELREKRRKDNHELYKRMELMKSRQKKNQVK